MKSRVIVMAGALALGFCASMAIAGSRIQYLPTEEGVIPDVGGQTKLSCENGTVFKNQAPYLTNGSGGSQIKLLYDIGGKEVSVLLNSYGQADPNGKSNNSFDFEVSGGVISKMIVSSGQTLTYNYEATTGPISADKGLNATNSTAGATDVSHLDFCLVATSPPPPDLEAPSVHIASPVDGEMVSGIVVVRATVTDNAAINSVSANVNGVSLGEATLTSPNQYEWTWDTTALGAGTYVLTVSGTDTSDNTTTVSVTVEKEATLQECLEGSDGVPPGEDGIGGCEEAGVTLEYPEALRDLFPTLTVMQAAIPALPNDAGGNQTTACGLADDASVLNSYITQDTRVDENGDVIALSELHLSQLFDIQGHFERYHPEILAQEFGGVAPDVILEANNVAAICVALYHQHAPEFSELASSLPTNFYFGPDGPTSTLTQDPKKIGMYARSERISAPLNFCDPDSDALCKPLPECFADENVKCFQPSLQNVEQAVVQPDDSSLLVQAGPIPFAFVGTYEVYNASRTKGYKGTFAALNTRQVCLELVSGGSVLIPGSSAYLAAEFQCKIDQALKDADITRQAVEQSARNLPSPEAVNRILNALNRARGQIDNVQLARALRYVVDLRDEIHGAPWDPIDEFNDEGRLTMYARHLQFSIEQLISEEACLESTECLEILDSQVLP